MAVEMEVNAQLGEFTVRKNRLKSLQRSVPRDARLHGGARRDAGRARRRSETRSKRATGARAGERGGEHVDKAVAGDGGGGPTRSDDSADDEATPPTTTKTTMVVHCAEVRRSKHRLWMRLVGLRHDVQLWDRDRRAPQSVRAPYQPLFTNAQIAAGLDWRRRAVRRRRPAAAGAVGLSRGRAVDRRAPRPRGRRPRGGYLAGVELFMPLTTVDGTRWRGSRIRKAARGPRRAAGADRSWGFERRQKRIRRRGDG